MVPAPDGGSSARAGCAAAPATASRMPAVASTAVRRLGVGVDPILVSVGAGVGVLIGGRVLAQVLRLAGAGRGAVLRLVGLLGGVGVVGRLGVSRVVQRLI